MSSEALSLSAAGAFAVHSTLAIMILLRYQVHSQGI